jgi:hypothetical protein
MANLLYVWFSLMRFDCAHGEGPRRQLRYKFSSSDVDCHATHLPEVAFMQ